MEAKLETITAVVVQDLATLCGGDEDVQGVLTLVRRGAAQVCHVLRAEELREQLEVEEEDGDRQEEEEEVENGKGRIKESAPWMEWR